MAKKFLNARAGKGAILLLADVIIEDDLQVMGNKIEKGGKLNPDITVIG